MTRRPARNPQSGVTLLEVMIVLAVIALIVGFGAPRLMESFGRAKSQAAEVSMANLKGAVQLFYIDTGRYPSEAEGLSALLAAPDGVTGWKGPYLDGEADLTDPWGRPFTYASPADAAPFSLSTLGRDGQPGGQGEDSDISL
ncbi:MAG: type secretion system protein GspG [Pseudomonadota bacterium]|jgi:general secretion pathway protein G